VPRSYTAGAPTGWPDESWAGIAAAIEIGHRSWPLPHVRSLDHFCELYLAEAGTVETVVTAAVNSRILLETPAAKRVAEQFLSQRVDVAGESVRIADLPATGGAGSPNIYDLLAAWYDALAARAGEPMSVAYAWRWFVSSLAPARLATCFSRLIIQNSGPGAPFLAKTAAPHHAKWKSGC